MIKNILLVVILIILLFVIYANWPIDSLPEDITIDKIAIEKSNREMIVYKDGKALKCYEIVLGSNPEGHKLKEGDSRTPEGVYSIDYKNPNSSYHLSLHISYPNNIDKQRADENDLNPGGMIMIHGIKNGLGIIGRLHRLSDWTDGCIAVTDSEIEEIWRITPVGIKIEINP